MNFELNDKVVITEEAKENYGDVFQEGDYLVITDIATSTDDHQGYDDSMEGMPLFSFDLYIKGKRFSEFGNSLYEYEIEHI